ncbi:hypothetical protein BKA81DRAFT_427544 [Phyllosticta paracitricarpa]
MLVSVLSRANDSSSSSSSSTNTNTNNMTAARSSSATHCGLFAALLSSGSSSAASDAALADTPCSADALLHSFRHPTDAAVPMDHIEPSWIQSPITDNNKNNDSNGRLPRLSLRFPHAAWVCLRLAVPTPSDLPPHTRPAQRQLARVDLVRRAARLEQLLADARKNYRRVRALWHPVADRKLRTEASLEKHAFEGSDGTARNPTTAPGLRPMFNLSLAQIAVISSIIDDVYETAKFHVITHWFRGLRRKYSQKHKSWILDGGQAMPDVRQDVEWERRRQMHISRLMDDDGARYLEIPTWQHAMEDVGYD